MENIENHNLIAEVKVLIVDDDDAMLYILSRFVSLVCKNLFDPKIDTAKGAAVALENANKYPYDLIMTDMNMMEMDGLELIDGLKDTINAQTHVCIQSGYVFDEDKRIDIQTAHPNVIGFLNKPYNKKEIRRVIEKSIAEHKADEKASKPNKKWMA